MFSTGDAAKNNGAFNSAKWCRKKRIEMNKRIDVYFL